MNNWKAVGYIFFGFGAVLLVFSFIDGYEAASTFFGINTQLAESTFFAFITPWAVFASFSIVVGSVGVYSGRKEINPEEAFYAGKKEINPEVAEEKTSDETEVLQRINHMEEVVDNNFAVISKRLNKIEQQQKRASEDTLIKAKKE